jgi:predicted metal-dependent hydrolase
MHATMRDLWEWHALEEIEHKAVAFDLFKEAGGGYFLRIFSAVLSIIADARLFGVLIRRARADAARQIAEGTWNEPVLTAEELVRRNEAIAIERRATRKLFWAGAAYFVPGFHPWKVDDSRYVKRVAEQYEERPAQLPALTG